MRSEWADPESIGHVLAALTPENRLVCEVALRTGLRLGDVLRLRTDQVARAAKITVQEQKTGKSRRVTLPGTLRDRLLRQAGSVYIFPGRNSGRVPRSRQAVYKDVKRAAKAFRITANVTPHSLRKAYAVELLRRTGGDLEAVRKALNHNDGTVTLIYALADRLSGAKRRRK